MTTRTLYNAHLAMSLKSHDVLTRNIYYSRII